MSVTLYPVVEVFGPTLQGEGAVVGQRCSFVRLAFCDYSCPWCDTKYATTANGTPKFTMLGAEDIADALRATTPNGRVPDHVTLTGGNPVIQPHCDYLFEAVGPRTNWNVETQGSLFQEWLNHPQVGSVTMSPKLGGIGPGTGDAYHWARKIHRSSERLHVKIVVFTPDELDAVAGYYAQLINHCSEFIIQTGTLPDDTRRDVLDRYRWIAEAVLDNEHLARVRVLPQMHVLLWKHRTGV
jgi:7-carboxy-7-deazaguanine synthase